MRTLSIKISLVISYNFVVQISLNCFVECSECECLIIFKETCVIDSFTVVIRFNASATSNTMEVVMLFLCYVPQHAPSFNVIKMIASRLIKVLNDSSREQAFYKVANALELTLGTIVVSIVVLISLTKCRQPASTSQSSSLIDSCLKMPVPPAKSPLDSARDQPCTMVRVRPTSWLRH